MYSYSQSAKDLQKIYDSSIDAYMRVFQRVGLGEITYVTSASGGAFTKYSHEFQTITDAGEDIIYVNRDKRLAINEEVYNDKALEELGLQKENLEKVKAVEVGNIFNFGTVKSEQLGLYFTDENGKEKPVYLGSYGIGITRLMGVIAEHFADEKGLVWPKNIAPFTVYLVRLGNSENIVKYADEIYSRLTEKGITVLYDDRDERAGAMLKDADLIGTPYRLVVSEKSLSQGLVELKERTNDSIQLLSAEDVIKSLVNNN
jgi:prolyl-tRNA synthetase